MTIRVGLRHFGRILARVRLAPSAWAYFNTVGTVDLREQGGYYKRTEGRVALYVDAPPSQQGGYFNRE